MGERRVEDVEVGVGLGVWAALAGLSIIFSAVLSPPLAASASLLLGCGLKSPLRVGLCKCILEFPTPATRLFLRVKDPKSTVIVEVDGSPRVRSGAQKLSET